ncbi:pentapeptide repeat-containing protein [Labrenzia sp. OB1]|uniref:pentapeptide repeat-containing protein n=1 Tax=Labrenzia sp. OB1 TaxID=1561204 RepID=UPI0007B18327|nr:pentapeptide repeat-containing protein [Labrenzia sp. OB1]KZM47732.1 hypothetical protein OA90_24575 [Labrenzia sp. OB1]
MSNGIRILAELHPIFLVCLGIGMVALVWVLSSISLYLQKNRGLSLADAKEEMEVRKAFFTIAGMIGIVVTLAFTASELSVAVRAENREQLYAALGQLAATDAQGPEVSAAALLQLGKLGATSEDDLPALVRVVNAYLAANAKSPVTEHNDSDVTRPDIEVAMSVLSDLVSEKPDLGSLVRLKGLDLRYLRAHELFLPYARLIDVNLSGASLKGAEFSNAEFVSVVIENGNFSEVGLSGSSLRGLVLAGTPYKGTGFCESDADNRRIEIDDHVRWTTEECQND